MTGPQVPRKDTLRAHVRGELENAAYMIGLLLATQRIRAGYTQMELSAEVGIGQADISNLENGFVPDRINNAQIARL